MKLITLYFLLIISTGAFAQGEPFFKNFDWERDPEYQIDEDGNELIQGLKHQIVTEFHFNEDQNLVEYMLEHNVLWLNSDEKIEGYNKIYLPHSNTSRLLVTKARVITPDGEIKELDESKVLTAKDDETGRQYKYFAFEGVEKGSIIDYYYVVERKPDYNGKRLSFQASFDKKNIDFDLYAPANLEFEFKSYNGLPEVEKDEELEGKLHWQISAESLAGLEREELSAYEASRASVIYKLDRNTTAGVYDISSYAKVSQNVYGFYYGKQSRRIEKELEKLSKSISKKESDLEKLRDLEYLIKTEFYVAEASGEGLGDLETILEKKVASETGIIKLYTALFKHMGISHELVFTSDRTELKFDKDFEAQNFLTDVLFYFPELDLYMSPVEMGSRIGYPPATLTDNYGLFVKEVVVGDFKSGLGRDKIYRSG